MSDHANSNYRQPEEQFSQDGPDSVSPTMEEFEMEDEDGPLLTELETVHGKRTRSCPPGRPLLNGRKKWQLLLVIAVSVFILLSFLGIGASLLAGGSLKSTPEGGPPSQSPGSNSTTDSPWRDDNSTLIAKGHSYVKAILDPADTTFSRLDCPVPTTDRYSYLQNPSRNNSGTVSQPRYFFALDLHQCIDVLPRLMGSILEAIRFLGSQNCALSLVEGGSNDGTFEVLKLLQEELEQLNITYLFTTSEIDPGKDNNLHSISALAELRNLAIRPLVNHVYRYDPEVTIIFINDVAICMEDILELVHQRLYQEADMACAMDWTIVGPDPTFHDVWIARGMNGDSFFNIPADGNWDSALSIFWNNPIAQQRQRAGQPFQVFSCWNGAVAFTAKPLTEDNIRFRGSRGSECFQSERKIFAKELWHHGYGKIAVIPSVNLGYSDEAAKKIKAQKGFVSRWVKSEEVHGMQMEWEEEPPAKVKCIPTYENQSWPPWDEGL